MLEGFLGPKTFGWVGYEDFAEEVEELSVEGRGGSNYVLREGVVSSCSLIG